MLCALTFDKTASRHPQRTGHWHRQKSAVCADWNASLCHLPRYTIYTPCVLNPLIISSAAMKLDTSYASLCSTRSLPNTIFHCIYMRKWPLHKGTLKTSELHESNNMPSLQIHYSWQGRPFDGLDFLLQHLLWYIIL